MATDFNKVVRIGAVPMCDRQPNVYCKIEYKDGRLSISGVEGPSPNGNAIGSCGQIVMSMDEAYCDSVTFAPGWDRPTLDRFLAIWREYHLNDMRPECQHQRAAGWREKAKQEVVLYRWVQTIESIKAGNAAKEAALTAMRTGETFTPTPEQAKAANVPYDVVTLTDECPAGYKAPESRSSSMQHIERKTLGWLRPSEHPEGLLCRPCPECGYKYGSAWLKIDVPEDAIEFLLALPDSDKKPAWV